MGSSFGNALHVSIFGQSHSDSIGCVVEGLPAGFTPAMDELRAYMARRAPGRASWSTPRREADEVRVLSGLNQRGETCGAPLALLIENTNVRSGDYDDVLHVPRPGHADFTAEAKWRGHQDVPGGGHFSGRLTAPLCAAGAIALQVLASRGVRIGAHLAQVAEVHDELFYALELDEHARWRLAAQLDALADGRAFPTIDQDAGRAMIEVIDEARSQKDSVGGVVECVACNLPAGIGDPLFDGVESTIARIAFGVGGVKALEFGAGFKASSSRGSQNNDPFGMVDGRPAPLKNAAGGNLGGITTGAPLIFRLGIKPTPSIARPQHSVDMDRGDDTTLELRGRHDPCIAPRAVPVAEAIMALAVLDCWLWSLGWDEACLPASLVGTGQKEA